MKRVLVPIAPGVEELEAVTIIDLLRRAGVEVVVAGLDPGEIVASRGVRLLADVDLDEVTGQQFDLIVCPGGGPGAARLREDSRLLAMIRQANDAGRGVAAICAAPTVLEAAGVLSGRRATSYPGFLAEGEGDYEYSEAPVVRDGNVITSRGPGTAMDFALTLVDYLLGHSARRKVETPLMRPGG